MAVDLPGDDQPVRWLPGQHPPPVALAAVGALFVPAAALAWFQDGGGHVGLADVVLGRPPAIEVLGEGPKGPVDSRVDGDGSGRVEQAQQLVARRDHMSIKTCYASAGSSCWR